MEQSQAQARLSSRDAEDSEAEDSEAEDSEEDSEEEVHMEITDEDSEAVTEASTENRRRTEPPASKMSTSTMILAPTER